MTTASKFHVLTLRDLQTGLCRNDCLRDPARLLEVPQYKRTCLLQNPAATDLDMPYQIVGLREEEGGKGDLAIGRVDLMPGKVTAHGTPYTIWFGSGFYVPPEERGSLLGLSLIIKMQQMFPLVAAFGPSAKAGLIYRQLRWLDLELPRFVLLRRSRPILRKYLRAEWLARAVAAIVDLPLRAWWCGLTLRRAVATRRLQAEIVDEMPEGLNPKLAKSAARPFACHRSSKSINWLLQNRLRDDADDRQELMLVRAADGDVVGYLLLKRRFYRNATQYKIPELTLVSLQDWMIFDEDLLDFRALLHLAIGRAAQLGGDAVEVSLPDPGDARVVRSLGFTPIGVLHMLIRPSPGSPFAEKAAGELTQWFIRPGDGEAFFS